MSFPNGEREAIDQCGVNFLSEGTKMDDGGGAPGGRHIGAAQWSRDGAQELRAVAVVVCVLEGCGEGGRDAVQQDAGREQRRVEVVGGAGNDGGGPAEALGGGGGVGSGAAHGETTGAEVFWHMADDDVVRGGHARLISWGESSPYERHPHRR
ncbi:MAG: hypothetical protein KIS91_02110 [Anaerolineae bacterium]|nr:hypothetical protein [Anaerolineae bacterium]